MRLLIISLMPHHLRDGRVVGWGPTVRELDHLATRFSTIRHVATLYDEPAPASALEYRAPNIELVPVRPSGAPGFVGKLDVLRRIPHYLYAMMRELPSADMVHVRAPASISLLAMVLLATRSSPAPRWIKYAGNWQPDGKESPSYTFQRWWLSQRFHRSIVTVNGRWPDQPPWIRTFYNPSLEDADLERGREAAGAKSLRDKIRMLFIGRVETPKGAGRALAVLARLRAKGIDATLELIGDGPERAAMEKRASDLGVAEHATFLGWLPHTVLHEVYTRAHVMLLPTSASEGWPKVLSEGMAYGVVPLAGAVSSIPQYLDEMKTGAALPPDDIDGFVAKIEGYLARPETWAAESRRAVESAKWFTFSYYLESIDRLLADLGLANAS